MELVNQQLIKDTNLKLLYNAIYKNDGISRADLAKLSKLSKTTVSTLIDELINKEFIYDSGTTESVSVGRKPNNLHVRKNSYFMIVISWLENISNVYLMDICGTIVYEEHMELEEQDTYVTISQRCVYGTILSKVAKEKILGICVVVSAMIDRELNEIYSTTLSLPKKGYTNLIDELKLAFKEFPVAILEDTACYAYAEKVFTNVTESDFAFINFGRGIGATLFIGGEMLGHASGSSTQFGHYSINHYGRPCICGNNGCLEANMGELVLKERINELGGSIFLDGLEKITFSDLGKAVQSGDFVAKSLIKLMAEELSYALSNLICIVSPKLIIIGGKSKNLDDLFINEIKNNLKKDGFRKMVDKVDVRYTQLNPENAYLNGSVKYFFDIHYKFTKDLAGSFFIG